MVLLTWSRMTLGNGWVLAVLGISSWGSWGLGLLWSPLAGMLPPPLFSSHFPFLSGFLGEESIYGGALPGVGGGTLWFSLFQVGPPPTNHEAWIAS